MTDTECIGPKFMNKTDNMIPLSKYTQSVSDVTIKNPYILNQKSRNIVNMSASKQTTSLSYPEVSSYVQQRHIHGTMNPIAYSQPVISSHAGPNNQCNDSNNPQYLTTSVYPQVGSFAYRYSPERNIPASIFQKQMSASEKALSMNIQNPYKKTKIISTPNYNLSHVTKEQMSVYLPPAINSLVDNKFPNAQKQTIQPPNQYRSSNMSLTYDTFQKKRKLNDV